MRYEILPVKRCQSVLVVLTLVQRQVAGHAFWAAMEQSEEGSRKGPGGCDGVVVGDENRLKQIITNLAGYDDFHSLTSLDLTRCHYAETLANSPPLAELSRSLLNCSTPVLVKSLG